MAKVLVLGAGMVSRPIVNFLFENKINVSLADCDISKAKAVVGDNPLGKAVLIDANDEGSIESLVAQNDLTVSLLPYAFHPRIAAICIKHKKNMVTTSYVKKDMKDLDKKAKEAGVILLNEIGVDPGIDHMSAKKIIDEVHKNKGRIKEFYSFTGALPAPEEANNPFKYKFSWSPKGVVMASKNPASYKRFGKMVEVSEEDLFKDLRWIEVPGVGKVEVYPNRDSIPYAKLYDVEEADTIIRGTIRFVGWSEILDSFKSLKMISYDEINVEGKTYAQYLAELIGEKNTQNLRDKLAQKLNIDSSSNIIKAFEYLGFFEKNPLNYKYTSPFEILSDLMIEKMMLPKGKKDMVIMQHIFVVENADGSMEVIKSSMVDYGIPDGDTSISRSVALPAAIATKMILNGKITEKGVHIPILPNIYNPVLMELEKHNIKLIEEYGLKETGIIRKSSVV